MKTNRRYTVRCWTAGLAMSFTLCVLIFGFGKVHAALNDDVAIIRALSGFSGSYPIFLPFTHSLIVWPVVWLHQHIPSIHWYSWLMVCSFYFSVAVVFKSLFQRSADGKWWLALLLGLASFVLIWLTAAVDLTFTNISTFLGCAAAVQLLSFEVDKATPRQMLGAVLLAFALAALGYALRMENLYPILGFCGLASLVHFFSLRQPDGGWRKEKLKPLLCCLSIPVIGLTLLIGWRTWECNLPQNREIMEWQDASEVVMDYQGMGELPEEVLSDIGLTCEDVEVMKYWYFLDSDFDTDAFEKIAAYQSQHLAQQSFWERLLKSQSDMWHCIMQESYLFGGVVWIVLCFLFCACGQKNLRRFAGFSLICWFVLMSFLAYRGRIIGRGMLAVIGPEAMLLTVLAIKNLSFDKWRNWSRIVLLGLLSLLAAGGTALQAENLLTSEFDLMRAYRRQNLWSYVDYCAEQEPDTLYILDSMYDDRLFPDMKKGRLTNVMLFGVWPCRDSDVEAQLRRFGIDPEHMDGSLFLQDNVRLVSMDEQIEKAMGDYIRSQFDEPVEAVEEWKFELNNLYFKIIRFQLKQE